jgi:biopolymer transport protein ExbD
MKGGSMLSISKWKTGGALAALVLMFLALSWALPGGEAQAGKKGKTAKGETIIKVEPAEVGINITLHGEGRMDMDGKKMDLVAFNKAVVGLASKKNGPVINLRCEDDVAMGELFAFQAFLTERDLHRIRFVGAGENGIPYKLPGSGLQEKLAQIGEQDKLRVFINAKGKCSLGGKNVKETGLVKSIEKRLAENPMLVLIIQTDAETPYLDFMNHFRKVKVAGATRVAIAPPKEAG